MNMIERIINALAGYRAPNVFNPWRDVDPLDVLEDPARARRERLLQHFDCRPRFLLIGEAPGYQGCHFSGVAFTNESLLINGAVPRVDVPGRITSRPRPWAEPSATIVWRTLYELDIATETVMWNAFAWHPHKPAEPMSNRRPNNVELRAGRMILEAVCAHFSAARIIAVGRVAELALAGLRIAADAAVRHPSMGGAAAFKSGLQAIVNRHYISPELRA